MHRNNRLLFPIAFLVFSILACNIQSAGTSTPNSDVVGTIAALTLTPEGVTPTSGTTATSTLAPTTTAIPTNTTIASPTPLCDNALFVSETIPDGTVFAPGAAFTKTWRLRNIGVCTWTTSYTLVFDSGESLNAPASVPFTSTVNPGQEVDIAVNMQAPIPPGSYTGNWKLRNASGVLFGLGPSNAIFWVKIMVGVPTATPTAGPGPSTQQVYTQVTALAGGVGHAVTNCPAGTVVTGGGFAGSQNLFVYNTSATGNGWEVYAQNLTGSDQLLNSYAMCLSNTSGSTQQVYTQVTAPASGVGHAVVNCPSGSVVTGGGFAGNTNFFVYNNSAAGNGWEVYAQNLTGSGQLLNSYAMCLSGTSGSTQQVYSQVTASGSGIGHVLTACPSGTYLTGGGYAGNQNLFVYNTSATGNGWEVYAQNLTGSGQLLNSYAICLTLP